MAVNGTDALLLKTTGGTIVKDQTVNDLGAFLSSGISAGQICGGRLGLQQDVPISTSDQTAKPKIYLNAYLSDRILLYDGTAWVSRAFNSTDAQVAPPATASKAFDIFARWDGSDVLLETVNWTNDTTRATSLAHQDGVLVKSGDPTRLYLGSARTVASGQTESSGSKRFLWNNYNPVSATFEKALQGTDGLTYDSTTPRQISANSANQVEAIVGVDGGHGSIRVTVMAVVGRGVAGSPYACVSVALDSTSALSKVSLSDLGFANSIVMSTGFWEGFVPLGFHYFSGNQRGAGTGSTCAWYITGTERGFTGAILC